MAGLTPDNINYIVVHASATPPSQDIGFKEIDDMHRARTYRTRSGKTRNWSGCGYHLIIRRDGVPEMGRSLQTKGAHVGGVGHNHDSWGICMIGGVTEDGKPDDNYTALQMNTLELLIRGLLHRAPNAEVVGHRDLSRDLNGDGVIDKEDWMKDCPCFYVVDWWKSVASGNGGSA